MPRKSEMMGINIRASFHLVVRVEEGTDIDQLLRQRIEWIGEPTGNEKCGVVAIRLKDWSTLKDWNANKGLEIKSKPEQSKGTELAALCNTKACNFRMGGECGVYKRCKQRT